jgi:hypothetical protein
MSSLQCPLGYLMFCNSGTCQYCVLLRQTFAVVQGLSLSVDSHSAGQEIP